MTATLRGVSASTVIAANSLLRLTFGETHSFTNDEEFVKRFSDVFNQLPPTAGLFPIARFSSLPGATTATVDATTHASRTAGEIVQAIETLTGYFVELRSLQLLTPAEKAVATTPAGAIARDDAAAKAEAVAQTNNPLVKLWAGIEEAGTVAKWVVIAAVFFGLLIYAGQLRKSLST